MSQFFAKKKNFLINPNFNIDTLVSILIIFFPFSIIIGTAFVELTAILIGFYGLYILIYKKIFRINYIFVLLFLIYISANLSSILSEYSYEAFSRSLFLFRYPLFFFGVFYFLSNNAKILNYLFLSILFCVFFVYLDDLIQFIYNYDIFGFQKQAHRLSGPFDDELIPGIYLFRFGLISLCFISYKYKENFTLFFLITIMLLIGVIITGEKTTSVITFFSISIFFLIRFGLKKIVFLFLIIIVFLSTFVTLINTNDIYKERIWGETKRTLGIFQTNRNFFDSEHGVMFLTSLYIWKDNKYFGGGLKTYRENCKLEKYSNIKSLVVTERCSTHPHNFYLEILSELGIFGFILFLFLILYLLKKIYKNYIKYKNIISLGVLCTLVGIFFPLNFTNSFFTNFNLLWIIFIISLGLINIDKYKNE